MVNELRHRRTLSESIGRLLSAPFRRSGAATAEHHIPEAIWAIKDVSFELSQGQVMGVLGRNGSGKSTLLKILARITSPTEGMAVLSGRVGALLEIGTGFHPDLSGRENILLNGTMLGMTPTLVGLREDAIIEFSEVGDFIDTPVKHYSSGMFMRLAFAVSTRRSCSLMKCSLSATPLSRRSARTKFRTLHAAGEPSCSQATTWPLSCESAIQASCSTGGDWIIRDPRARPSRATAA